MSRRSFMRAMAMPARQAPMLPDPAQMDVHVLARHARIGLNQGDLGEDAWRPYAVRALQLAPDMTVSEVARFTSTFAQVRLRDFDLFSQLSSRALVCLQDSRSVPSVSALDLRRLTVAFGRVRIFDGDLMEALVPLIEERAGDFRPRELAQVADAYARLPVQNLDLFALVADALPPYLYDLSPLELATLCRSFAEAAVYNQELFDALGEEVVKRLRSFGSFECLMYLDSFSRIHSSLPDELRLSSRNETVAAVADKLATSMGSLGPSDLIRLFAALLRLDHYEQRLVHQRLCTALAQKLGQLEGSSVFADLATLLHCLSLLPDQSHKSMELALAACQLLRQRPQAEARPLALALSALSQLDHRDEELLLMLGGLCGQLDLMLATEEELADLDTALALHAALESTHATVSTELGRRISEGRSDEARSAQSVEERQFLEELP